MRNVLLTIFTLISFGSFSAVSLSSERLLLVFNTPLSSLEKDQIIKSIAPDAMVLHLPNPAVSIVSNKQITTSKAAFEKQATIKYAGEFYTDGQHFAGVLNQLIVRMNDGYSLTQLLDKNFSNEQFVIQPSPYLPNVWIIEITKSNILSVVKIAELLNQQHEVVYAAPNYLLNPEVSSSDPLYSRQWAVENNGSSLQGNGTIDADMDVSDAWGITTGSSTIKIAILDSGVDTLHPDLIDNLLPGKDAVGDSTNGFPTLNFQEDGHGTCCAGIAAADQNNSIGISGVAPLCKIIPVRSFYYMNFSGQIIPYSTALIFQNAISWAWQNGADILSNSWGVTDDFISLLPGGTAPVNDAIHTAFQNGRNGKGVALFFSSGNDNDSTGPIWPARLQETIAVGASDMCDKHKQPGDCSGENWGGNHGGNLDFTAPGVRIAATDARGAKGFANSDYYYLFNGTSASCPHAAAVGALLLSVDSSLTNEQVRAIIAHSCDKVGGYAYDSLRAEGSWCNPMGYGRINAFSALQYLSTYTSVIDPSDWNMELFPNPNNGQFTIRFKDANEHSICVYDVFGKTVYQSEAKGISFKCDTPLNAGVYFVSVNGTHNKKIIVYRE